MGVYPLSRLRRLSAWQETEARKSTARQHLDQKGPLPFLKLGPNFSISPLVRPLAERVDHRGPPNGDPLTPNGFN
jgi:hypothetical protein